ncbi:MAG: GDP-mannose dehydrogenase [Candidatus Bathycorpusculaceae bacterium]
MAKEKALVVGLGDVGRSLFELIKESESFVVYGFDVDKTKMKELEQKRLPNTVDIVHICIPYFNKNEFVKAVTSYAKQLKPKLLIIDSTVPPKTTLEVYKRLSKCLVAHSPVRGVHKSVEHMKWELKRWTKYVGGATKEAAEAAQKHFEKLGLKTKILKSCLETELAKLFETTYRAWMIACFQEMHRISTHFKADFDEIVDFLEDIHRVRFDRPIMFPGFIGGCLIPNAEILLKSFDSDFLRLLLKSNEKRKRELENKYIFEEVEKIRKRVEALEKELAEKS